MNYYSNLIFDSIELETLPPRYEVLKVSYKYKTLCTVRFYIQTHTIGLDTPVRLIDLRSEGIAESRNEAVRIAVENIFNNRFVVESETINTGFRPDAFDGDFNIKNLIVNIPDPEFEKLIRSLFDWENWKVDFTPKLNG